MKGETKMFIVTTNYLYDFFVGVYSTEDEAREGMYKFINNECLTIIDNKNNMTYIEFHQMKF